MSRRYGRKQRRAAREMILDLSWASAEAQRRLAACHGEMLAERAARFVLLDRIEEWDADIRSMLGPYTSFAVNDTTFRVDTPDRIRQLPVMPPLHFSPILDMAQAPEMLSYHVSRILNIVTRLDEDDLMTLRKYMRLQIRCGTDREGETIFGMSEEYWHHLQRDPAGRPRQVRDIAEQLLHKLAEPRKPKPRPLPSESWTDARG